MGILEFWRGQALPHRKGAWQHSKKDSRLHTLPKVQQLAGEKGPFPEETTVVFQASIFQGLCMLNFRSVIPKPKKKKQQQQQQQPIFREYPWN